MLRTERSADRCALEATRLRLVFEFVEDRWQHSLAFLGEDGRERGLRSVETPLSDGLPASPVFQSLQLEEIGPEVHEVQLFGQWAACVFSGAVRFDGPGERIDFDLAARFQPGALPRVRSTYRLERPEVTSEQTEAGARLRFRRGVCLDLLPRTVAGSPAIACRPQPDPGSAGELLSIGCSDLPDMAVRSRHGVTIRWQYRISISDGA